MASLNNIALLKVIFENITWKLKRNKRVEFDIKILVRAGYFFVQN